MSNDVRIKMVTDIIIEWAENNKEIEFNRAYCKYYADHNTIRYWTKKLTGLIPNNTNGKESGFGNFHPYAFEIECKLETLHFLLAFSYTNISDVTKEKCEEILEKYRMYRMAIPKDYTGNFRRVCDYKIDIKNKSKEEIVSEMNKYYYQMKGYEEFICYKMLDEKND
jgi:hypothetical protein